MGARALALDSIDHVAVAGLYAVQGRTEDAMARLERLVEENSRNLVWVKANIALRSLHPDPRFQRLIADALAGR